MTCPSNIVVTSCFNVQEFYNPTAYSYCCGVLYTNVICTPPSGSIFAVGTTTTVTCSATDCAQNTNDCTFTVTVLQGTNCATNCLQIQCPSNIVVTSCTNLPVFYAPTVTDSCCSNWSVNCTPPSGSFFAPNTTNLVICTATDYCGMSNDCSFTVTVLSGTNCPTNCIDLICPSNIVITTCSNCAQAFYAATATNSCCFDHVVLNYSTNSGSCFPLGTNTVTVTAYDPDCASTPPTYCNFTVTVIQGTNCCNTTCCGPGLGAQTIQWLQFPTNGTIVSDPSGTNPQGSWIVTNMGCYGNVLVTQNFPDLTYWFLNPNSAGVPNGNGLFNFTAAGYGPYAWGTGSWMDFYASNNDNYTINFYFLDGPPNPCQLVLGIDGLAESTVATVSQPVMFMTEFDLNSPLSDGTFSAHTKLDTIYGPPVAGTIGTAVGSAYLQDGYGDNRNTGWAVLRPTNNLPTTNLANGSVSGYFGPLNNLPYLSVNVSQEAGDGIGFTVGYICCTPCATNCLQVQCPTNKTVQCGSNWMFAWPTASSCCSNLFYTSGGATNVLIIPTTLVSNGMCPQQITQSWQIIDGCGDTNTCSQTVTVEDTLPPTINCPANIVISVTNCNTNVPVCYTPTAFDPCSGSNLTVTCTPPSCSYFAPGTTTTVNCVATNCNGLTNSCSFTVTVNCCSNFLCCGPGVGGQTIHWLQGPPPNTPALLPNPLGSNTAGTWIITNLPCYGNVLVTQTCPSPTNDLLWYPDPLFENVGNSYGNFADMEAGYGPYSWGTFDTLMDFYDDNSSNSISYNVNYYFLDGPPNPCTLYLGVIGLAESTTATVSQPVTFRGEYDLVSNAPYGNGRASAYTTLSGHYPAAGLTGTNVGSAYAVAGPGYGVGDVQNTGWAILQPATSLLTTNLPAGSGTDLNGNPYPAITNVSFLTLVVNQEAYDGIAFSVGYVCCSNCSTPCLQVQCPTNKTIPCGTTNWSFDLPIATSCCTNEFVTGPATETNVLITSLGIVTNGACPQAQVITQTWSIIDGCGNSNTCSQVVTVECCPTTNCFDLTCPSNIVVTTCSNCVPVYYSATASACCTNVLALTYNPPSGTCFGLGTTTVQVTASACGLITNCEFTVTVNACTNCLQVQCPTNKTVPCGSTWTFDSPMATTCCTNDVKGTKTNLVITVTSTKTNGVCPQVITQTWSIIDGCGNTDTCTQIVTVEDNTPPTINCPTNAVVVTLNSNCQLVIPTISVSATEACTPCSLTYTQVPPAGAIVSGTNAYVTVTVTDPCGNSNSCRVLVEGMPKAGLVVTWPTNLTASDCVVPCVSNYVTAMDCACPTSDLRITQSPPCGTQIGPGISSVTVTVTDCNGATAMKVIPLKVVGQSSFISALTNTGIAVNGTLLGEGAIDPHYTLGPVPAGVPNYVAPDAVVETVILSVFPAVDGASEWIVPVASTKPIGQNLFNCPCCSYTYTNQFTLPAGANPATASISGRWVASQGATEIYLNNQATGNSVQWLSYGLWSGFTITNGFGPGLNTLRFVVSMEPTYSPSISGLRVEYQSANVCSLCAPPAIISITPSQSLQEGSLAAFTVKAQGTPPLSYQWQFNGVFITGTTNSTLQLPAIGYSAAGLYSVIVANPCGVTTGQVALTVTQPLPWPNGSWNVQVLTNPLAATFGPDLVLTGTSFFSTNFAISAGTTEDFGLPDPGGQIVNVMGINPQAGATIQVPVIAPSGSTIDNSYTVIMDIYEPDTSLGTPSTLFDSIPCCVSNLGSSGQDGVALTLDASNNLHITGSTAGVPFDYASATPMPVDAWNRVALVVDDPQDGLGGTLSGYLNGIPITNINPCICCTAVVTNINWNNGSPTVFSAPTNIGAVNGGFYVSSLQFHAVAMTPQMIAGIGSPVSGPPPVNQTVVGTQPVLSATMANGAVNISWSGSPYVLQETTDLSSGVWANSALPFTETAGTIGNIVTTAVATPTPSAPSKFFRLIFSP